MTLQSEVHKRKYLRSIVSKLHVDSPNLCRLSDIERMNKLLKVQNVQSDLKATDDIILNLKYASEATEAEMNSELESIESYQDKVTELLCSLNQQAEPTVESPTDTTVRSMLKSPTAPLPSFTSTEGENFELFIVNFEETLSKFRYSEYDKLLLLKQQISGRAAYLIDSLDPNTQTYSEAKSLLLQAFATSALQKFNVIKQLCGITLSHSDEPFKCMEDMRKIQQAVNHLQITVEDILQFFFLKGLNETFLTQLVHITNNVRPTLQEINDNFFMASERYAIALKSSKIRSPIVERSTEQNKSISLAIAVQNKEQMNLFKNCTLCFSKECVADHPINKCKRFLKPLDKIKRFIEINGCIKCNNLDHDIYKCKFRFKKNCNICDRWHFTFLCPDNRESKSSSTSRPSSVRTQNNVSVNTYAQSGQFENVLPTVTLKFDWKQIRGLLDSGSQKNLVSELILKTNNHVILDTVDLKIRGVNCTKT